jgi:hypothetical protein
VDVFVSNCTRVCRIGFQNDALVVGKSPSGAGGQVGTGRGRRCGEREAAARSEGLAVGCHFEPVSLDGGIALHEQVFASCLNEWCQLGSVVFWFLCFDFPATRPSAPSLVAAARRGITHTESKSAAARSTAPRRGEAAAAAVARVRSVWILFCLLVKSCVSLLRYPRSAVKGGGTAAIVFEGL